MKLLSVNEQKTHFTNITISLLFVSLLILFLYFFFSRSLCLSLPSLFLSSPPPVSPFLFFSPLLSLSLFLSLSGGVADSVAKLIFKQDVIPGTLKDIVERRLREQRTEEKDSLHTLEGNYTS